MRIETTSKPVIRVARAAMKRIPKQTRADIQKFFLALSARSDEQVVSLGVLDFASAMLAPRYRDFSMSAYDPCIYATLPIFRLFSSPAQVGIMVHEFAHASRASAMGDGWHEKVQSQYADEERMADSIAISGDLATR
jgi:hypothetical protein